MKSLDSAEPSVLFCDNHLLVAFKPAEWLTQPDDTARPNLEAFAKTWVKQKFHKPGAIFIHCIHRLDRSASGLVLFARTSKALSRLNEASRSNGIRRLYFAEIEGILSVERGSLEHLLVHGDHRAFVANAPRADAKRALLSYAVQSELSDTTLVQIELQTGRYHQIRAQFAAEGFPIVGDTRYGAKPQKDAGIRLCCTDLLFNHPVTKEPLVFSAQISYAIA